MILTSTGLFAQIELTPRSSNEVSVKNNFRGRMDVYINNTQILGQKGLYGARSSARIPFDFSKKSVRSTKFTIVRNNEHRRLDSLAYLELYQNRVKGIKELEDKIVRELKFFNCDNDKNFLEKISALNLLLKSLTAPDCYDFSYLLIGLGDPSRCEETRKRALAVIEDVKRPCIEKYQLELNQKLGRLNFIEPFEKVIPARKLLPFKVQNYFEFFFTTPLAFDLNRYRGVVQPDDTKTGSRSAILDYVNFKARYSMRKFDKPRGPYNRSKKKREKKDVRRFLQMEVSKSPMVSDVLDEDSLGNTLEWYFFSLAYGVELFWLKKKTIPTWSLDFSIGVVSNIANKQSPRESQTLAFNSFAPQFALGLSIPVYKSLHVHGSYTSTLQFGEINNYEQPNYGLIQLGLKFRALYSQTYRPDYIK